MSPFGITEMKIDCTEARPGETVTISFEAANTSDFTSIYPITLRINGGVVAAEVVSLPPRTAMPMKFTVSKALPGSYKVDVNNSIDTFTITGNAMENEIASLNGVKPDISNVEARFDLGLVGPEKPVQQKRLLVETIKSSPGRPQSVIDRMASCIEFGLDKVGDAIIFPIKKLVDSSTAMFKWLNNK